jgi:hypothetical protein
MEPEQHGGAAFSRCNPGKKRAEPEMNKKAGRQNPILQDALDFSNPATQMGSERILIST